MQVVPFNLGQKLFDETKATCDVAFREFPADLGLGHNNIYLDDDIETIIKDFVRASIEKLDSVL